MPRRTVIRAALGAAGSLFAAALLSSGVAHGALPSTESGVVYQPYAADSGDKCLRGSSKGTLVWYLAPGGRAVDGRGAVADRPLPTSPVGACPDDGRYTAVTFKASAKGLVVDTETQRVDNGYREFGFTLTSPTAIELIVVQVCRLAQQPGPADICGTKQEYPAPSTSG